MSQSLLTLNIQQERDIVSARQRARQASALLGFDTQDQIRIATAVSEIVRNALQHGRGGEVEFAIAAHAGAGSSLQIVVRDNGRGIRNPDELLSSHRENGETGMGMISARRMMDGFEIQPREGGGTAIRMSKMLPRRTAALSNSRIAQIARELSKGGINDPYAEAQEQNRELMRSLEELRLRQEELERLSAELEDTNRGVLALYAELDERAAHLRLADEAKTRFFSGVSHEFRTPVNSILALSQLLLQRVDGELSSEQVKQVSYIRQAAEQLGTLVDDLLDLRKAEAGKVTIRAETFTAHDLFGALRGMFKPLATNERVALILDEPGDLPELYTDQGKVAQILRNLISNALKFTERGSVHVTAHAAMDGAAIIFSVADTGIGIAPEFHRSIFEEFTQVEHALQTRVKGTGLGLPLSQRLAGLLGGTIEIKSALGEGSTFSLVIPARLSHMPAAQGEPARYSFASDQRQRVLIIDDNEVERYALRQFLAPGLYDIIEANGGYEGLHLARQHRPDLIFLDLMMPDIQGAEVLHLLRANEETRSVPIIIFTSKRPDRGDAIGTDVGNALLMKHELSRESVADVIRKVRLQ